MCGIRGVVIEAAKFGLDPVRRKTVAISGAIATRCGRHREGRPSASRRDGCQELPARCVTILPMAMPIFRERLPVHDAAPGPGPDLIVHHGECRTIESSAR